MADFQCYPLKAMLSQVRMKYEVINVYNFKNWLFSIVVSLQILTYAFPRQVNT